MDAGHATPQAALQTMAWAISTGNAEKFKQSVFFTDEARKFLTDLLSKMGPPEALEEVRHQAEKQLAWIDAKHPEYDHSSAPAQKRGHASIYEMLAEQAKAMTTMARTGKKAER